MGGDEVAQSARELKHVRSGLNVDIDGDHRCDARAPYPTHPADAGDPGWFVISASKHSPILIDSF